MPIYGYIQGVEGPLTYEGFKGYFDVYSIRFFEGYDDDHGRWVRPMFVFVRSSDALTPRLLNLLREPMRSTPRVAEFVFVGGESGKPSSD
jgi:hypothetical protein